MRWKNPRGGWALGAGLVVLALAGADGPTPKSASKQDGPSAKPATKLSSEEIVNDVADIGAADGLVVNGVGLVVGLDNTGADPLPSPARTKLLDKMRKADISNANELLASRWCAMVTVRASIPIGVDPTDRFDVEILPEPGSNVTSLAGGHLILTELSQAMMAQGEIKEGQVLALAGGPVMTGTDEKPNDLRSGRILEGGRVKKTLPFTIQLHEDRKSYHAARLVEQVINRRFHGRQGVEQKGMAEAKTDGALLLRMPPIYHQNPKRYFQIVKLLNLSVTPEQVESRMERWSKDLLNPETAGLAALKLEGIGTNAIPAIKSALDSPEPRVRFFAAEALAYLNDGAGAIILAETAAKDPDFRIYALAALAAMDQPAGVLRLRELMDNPDLSVRYGAFSALKKSAPGHHFLGRVRLIDDPTEAEGGELSGEPMALKLGPDLAARRRRDPLPEDPFALYVIESSGPPSVHISKKQRSEIVVFGRDAQLLTPVVLGGGGSIQINASADDRHVEISRIEPNQRERNDLKVTAGTSLPAVIRELVRVRATYPEIVGLLEMASAQKNLPGPLLVDAMPVGSTKYSEAQLAGIPAAIARKDDAVGRASINGKANDSKGGAKKAWGLPSLPRPNLRVRDWFQGWGKSTSGQNPPASPGGPQP
ncbi:MAG: flagellar basal body P-ring protein FlgI [Isosphaeraceae bacterium]